MRKPVPLYLYIAAIVVGGIAGWTGVAEGAWCSPPWLTCIVLALPQAIFGGLLFALPSLIFAALLVVVLKYGAKVRFSLLAIALLSLFMWVTGFVLGISPEMHGRGP
jgi:hypothetical protein